MSPREINAALVIVDISGYTDFIAKRTVSLLHAEQVITALMEAVIDRAEHPLIVNKLAGDAALLYRELGSNPSTELRSILAQVSGFFSGFAQALTEQQTARAGCDCDACSNLGNLQLKAFVHRGPILLKQVRQFEELAGEPVILIHRLLKNHVPLREYVLLSADVADALAEYAEKPRHAEQAEGLGTVDTVVLLPADLPATTAAPAVVARSAPAISVATGFQHLPQPRRWWEKAALTLQRWRSAG